ncbi:MAG: ATP-binding cassette domain-containing protein [Fervidobacterium sp.]|uniref:ABC-type cobalamin/Fe3+-siderophores transport system, ATPase component n=1 Tax=Fervidobacterium gondwanense DSM 13020 TaxID=1121883 RepID=A0A1M7SI03_FERGO|nr:ATP-binding cassette domain-containing protein [Fervidobacterium gondwanense]SHN58074.1 ABC-type cobalamin/Fe3+-siderophores transport system, ATPase component [Fervidobacterium gondwanense DSM 13020]
MRKKNVQLTISKVLCENFTATVEESILFENINLELDVGKFVILYGPRGSGKSAFLRSFSRLNRETYPNIRYSGKMYFDTTNVEDFSEKEIRQIVTYLDTNFLESLDYLNLKELIEIVFGHGYKFSVEEHATELDNFGVLKALDKFEKTPLSSLYVLEKIGLLLFISSIRQSSVLVLDCLLDHLDDEHIEFVTKMLKELSETKIIILATRTLKRFLGLGDLLIVMRGGKIVYSGEPEKYILGA